MWLIKPTSYNRGRGIRIFNDIETLVGYLKDFSDGVEESKILSKESIQKDEVIDEPITQEESMTTLPSTLLQESEITEEKSCVLDKRGKKRRSRKRFRKKFQKKLKTKEEGKSLERKSVITKRKKFVSRFKFTTFILQKYLEKPLLINKRKFDIRVWALLTQEMKFYFFRHYLSLHI